MVSLDGQRDVYQCGRLCVKLMAEEQSGLCNVCTRVSYTKSRKKCSDDQEVDVLDRT